MAPGRGAHDAAIDQSDIGCRAADIHREQARKAVMVGKCLGAFHAAARTGAVGLDRGGLGDAPRISVVTKNQQRALDALFAQLVIGVVEKAFHGRMQERIEDARPGPSDVILIIGEFVGVKDRQRPQEMRREGAQQIALDLFFNRLATRTGD